MKKKFEDHFYTNASWNYFILNMAVWWGSQGGTDEQHLSDKPPLIHVEKLTVPGSSTLPEIVLLQAFNS